MVVIDNYTNENKKELELPKFDSNSEFGRLHFVKSSRKISNCRICVKEIQLKESCFRQSVNNQGFFPVSSRVCIACAKKLIEQGTEFLEITKEELDVLKTDTNIA